MRVAIVSDSTGYLPAPLVPEALTVVPLAVVLGDRSFDEGSQITPGEVAEALRSGATVSTTRPAPARFAAAYADLAERGHDAVVSIHLSSAISGTYEAAQLAAREAPIPVTTVDSRTVAMALGFAVRSAAEVADDGGTAAEAARAAQRRASDSRTWFVVDSLDQLRRGGRIGAAQALLGAALSVKPILEMRDGRVAALEKQRTMGRAIARMAEIARERAGPAPADVAVQHCAAPERADALAATLRAALPAAQVHVAEVGAVISAHVGLGTVSVAVCPR